MTLNLIKIIGNMQQNADLEKNPIPIQKTKPDLSIPQKKGHRPNLSFSSREKLVDKQVTKIEILLSTPVKAAKQLVQDIQAAVKTVVKEYSRKMSHTELLSFTADEKAHGKKIDRKPPQPPQS